MQGVVALGLASEAPALTEEERDAVCATVARPLAGRLSFTVRGIDGLTAVAADRARRAIALGASALMVIPPAAARTPDQVVEHFARVADAGGGAPVLVQDAPQVTGVTLEPELLERLAASHTLVRSVKVEGLGAAVSRLVAGGLEVMAGWGGLHYPREPGARGVGVHAGLRPRARPAGDARGHAHRRRGGRPALPRDPAPAGLRDAVARPPRAGREARPAPRRIFTHDAMRAPAPSLDPGQRRTFDALFDRLAADGIPGPWGPAG